MRNPAGDGSPRLPPAGRCLGGVTLMLAVGLAGALNEARAEGRAIQWLMGEPVTLFDLGIYRLRQELHSTAERMADMGELPAAPRTGAFYDWHRQRIVAYVTLTNGSMPPNEAACRDVYEATVRNLLHGGPSGTRRAENYLENLFLHEGPGNLGRPRDLAADLAATVQLEVTILPRDPMQPSPQTVKCVGRLDSEPDEVKTSVRG